jgi:hypothetical protein
MWALEHLTRSGKALHIGISDTPWIVSSANTSARLRALLSRRRPAVIPIVGARSVSQLRENLAACSLRLDESDLRELDPSSAVSLGFPHEFLQGELATFALWATCRRECDAQNPASTLIACRPSPRRLDARGDRRVGVEQEFDEARRAVFCEVQRTQPLHRRCERGRVPCHLECIAVGTALVCP